MTKRFNTRRFAFAQIPANFASAYQFFPRRSKARANRPAANSTPVRFRPLARILATAAAITLLGAGWFVCQQRTHPEPPIAVPISNDYLSQEQFASRYGLRIERIQVILDGRNVDFQYRVLNPRKAAPLLRDPKIMPVLTALDTGLKLYPSRIRARQKQRVGASYLPYRFFPNARNAIKPGTPVSVSFGEVAFGPIIAD